MPPLLSLTAIVRRLDSLAARDVAEEEILERDLFWEERGEEKLLDERFRNPMEAIQRVAGGSVSRWASLGCLGMAPVSSPVLAGVRAAVRQVAVDVRDAVGL